MCKVPQACVISVAVCLLFLYSCVPQKGVTASKKELAVINTRLSQNEESLKQLDAVRAEKEQKNSIDDTANLRLKRFIDKTKQDIDTLINANTIMIGETVVDKSDWEQLRNSLTGIRSSSKKINDKILFLNDLINRNLVVKLDQDVIFEP